MSDEHDLVELARAGDRDAAGTLLMGHERMVYRTCRQLLPAGEDVDAATQETLLRGLRSLPRYRGAGGFGGWLAAIAVNHCRDRLRRRRLVPFMSLEPSADDDPGPLMVLPSSEPTPERIAMARQAVARLRSEVARLPRRQHDVFALRFYAGLDLDGIAAALGVEVGTVKTHLHRAVQRVRRAVEEARP